MAPIARAYDNVRLYMDEITSKIVAKSGIPSDRFHLGKMIVQGLKEDPDFILQTDGATEEFETNGSVLDRTVRCAISMRNLGLKTGDVIVLMGSNHIHLCIPMYAALNIGVIVAPLDATFAIKELDTYFAIMEPKIIFCESNKVTTVKQTLVNLKINTKIVTFDENDECDSLSEFVRKYGDDSSGETFESTDLDSESSVAYLTITSGTTGIPKAAALTHKNIAISFCNVWRNFYKFPTPTKLVLVVSPVQWLTAAFYYLFSPIFKFTRLQSSIPMTDDVFVKLVNKYKPTYVAVSPTYMATILKSGYSEKCDFTCFEDILLGGSVVTNKLLDDIKKVAPKASVRVVYGMSEIGGFAMRDGTQSPGSVGRPLGCFDYRLVNVETFEDIEESNVHGELWLRGPSVCMGYFKNEEETRKSFVDGWIRSGDIMYIDENGCLYFVDRLKLLLKYKNYQISPMEVEAVIRQHPGVSEVVVTGIEDQECGDLVVACIISKPGYKVAAQEIKDLVKENLSDAKQLRGGVIFMKEFPMTSSSKINKGLLKKIASDLPRE